MLTCYCTISSTTTREDEDDDDGTQGRVGFFKYGKG